MGFTLDELLEPELSRVAKDTNGLVCTIYGLGGLGKTPQAVAMEKPYYLAFGKSGLSGINNVPFKSIMSWGDFKSFVKLFTKNIDAFHEKFQTIVLDEMEILWSYCEKYVANSEGVNKIKEGNGGFGLWKDLKEEWESEIFKLIGSGFCVMIILHAAPDDNGRMFPVGDVKRMLPIIINHSEIVGYVKSNGIDENGKTIHSSLMLAGSDEYFARTRNEYFEPCIEDFTANNLVQAYYDALDKQAKAEGTETVTRAEQNKMYETKTRSFDDIMNELNEVGPQVAEKLGRDTLTEVVERTLGVGAKVSQCTEKQKEACEVILSDLKDILNS